MATPAAATTAAPAPPATTTRRCFICFMDEGESGATASDWVNPCPCSLEAHQDCLLDWVANLEREKKELRCPVCKAPMHVDGPWDPVVALSDQLRAALSRASPSLLVSGVGFGTLVGLGTYGLAAVRVVAGNEALHYFMYRWAGGRWRLNAGHVLLAPWIGPALVLGQSFPFLANLIFLPAASFYGVVHFTHDENFISWPPSPQLAIALLPSIKQAYNMAYSELFWSWEKRMDHQLLGLADPDLRRQAEEQEARGHGEGEGNVAGFVEPPRPALLQRLRELIDNIIDLPNLQVELAMMNDGIEDDDEEDGGPFDLGVEVEVVEAQAPPNFGELVEENFVALDAAGPAAEPAQDDGTLGQPGLVVPPDAPALENVPPNININNPPAQQQPPQANPPHQHVHQRLQTTFQDMTNAIVAALLVPGISYGFGELLRLALPRRWTTPTQVGLFRVHNGLLQERWGRSLVGGCVYVVLRDAFRLYAKHRRVANRPLRRVRNVERRKAPAADAAT